MDVYELLFYKMRHLGFPNNYEGYKMIYDFKNFQADILLFPIEYKLFIMRELVK